MLEAQLNERPQKCSNDSNKGGRISRVSKDEYDLRNSDLFNVKLRKIEKTPDRQRHLHLKFDEIGTDASIEKQGNIALLSQPSLTLNHNPNNASASLSNNLGVEMGLVGTSCGGGRVGIYSQKVAKNRQK